MTNAHPLPAKTIRIGRQPDNDIALGDLDVSRNHAELRRNPAGSFEIIDLGSHGGTYVNGERITRKMLTEQDIISIGHATFRLSGGELHPYAGGNPGSLPAITNADEVVAASWTEFTGPEGTEPGLCFFDLADDGKIALITDFWPEPHEPPASRAHLVERY
jgi:hypothetical protein